jgi:hypothetical protein
MQPSEKVRVYSRLHRWFKRNGTVFGGFEKIELLDTIKIELLTASNSKQEQATASKNKQQQATATRTSNSKQEQARTSNSTQQQATAKPRTMVKVSNVRVTLASVQDNAS